MKEYEIIIETINPCGGTKHAQNEIIEAEAESPEAYVKEHGIFPVMDVSKNTSGDVIITTGDSKGYIVRYTFTEYSYCYKKLVLYNNNASLKCQLFYTSYIFV